uniref:Uncharacterized protein n=1 Tax=Anguilla anguilla TaxID=7936 RepID=A0A0E9UT12_ANGAN
MGPSINKGSCHVALLWILELVVQETVTFLEKLPNLANPD